MRNGCLQCIEAIIKGQECMPAKGHDDRFFLNRKNCRLRIPRSCPLVGDRVAIAPLGHRLLIDTIALRQGPQALLTTLYRSTDRLSRCGAPMKNLAHSASFHAGEKIAPSNPGIKHLENWIRRKSASAVHESKRAILVRCGIGARVLREYGREVGSPCPGEPAVFTFSGSSRSHHRASGSPDHRP